MCLMPNFSAKHQRFIKLNKNHKILVTIFVINFFFGREKIKNQPNRYHTDRFGSFWVRWLVVGKVGTRH